MKYKLIAILFIGCIGGSVFGQTLTKKEKKSMTRIQKHVSYLASDRLEGRATGSPGELLSAEYVAAQFKKNGLKSLSNDNSYFQNFDIVTLRMAKDSCMLMVNTIPYFIFKDFYPLSYSANKGMVSGKLMNVEFGITANDLNYDDYKGKDATGKVVLINIGTPDSQSTHSKYSAYQTLENRVKNAVAHGAAGVIFINKGDSKDNPSGELAKNLKPSTIPVFFFNHYQLIYVPEVELPIIMKADILSISAAAHNVVGFKNNKAKYTVIIGAHHDHLGRGEIRGSRAEGSTEVHNGADDNASGTAALIELSKILKKGKYKKYNYLYIAFSGEEMGLLGSKYYVEHPLQPLDNTTYMINMDMVGRLKNTLIINGVGTSPYWIPAVDQLRKDSSAILKIKTTESGIGSSDHTSFYLAGIPSVHFFTGQHDEYHKPSDDIPTLNYNGEVKVIGKIVDLIANSPATDKLVYTKTKDEDMKTSFKVTLGIMPDYAFDGEGVRVDGVKDGRPAAVAGLKKGDIIVSLAGEKITNIEVYMKTLNKLEKGQTSEIVYIRDGNTVTAQLQF